MKEILILIAMLGALAFAFVIATASPSDKDTYDAYLKYKKRQKRQEK